MSATTSEYRMTAALLNELAHLRERTKPTEPPYLSCLWHIEFDHSCPWCLRHRIAILEAHPMNATTTPPDPSLAHPCDPDTLGNQCPECDCHGAIVIYHSLMRDWETGDYIDTEEIVCETCDGLGYLTTPADPDPDMQEAHEKARRFTITRR